MRPLLGWLLERVAGPALASDILGDIAESQTGTTKLFAIVLHVAIQRGRESVANIWRARSQFGASVADLRYAARALGRSPWYATTVIGVIALSTTLAIAVFAVVDGVLFKPLPYPRAADLVAVEAGQSGRSPSPLQMSWHEYFALADALPETTFVPFTVSIGGHLDESTSVAIGEVGPSFFEVLGQLPMVGGFTPEDFAGSHEISPAVITYSAWQKRFGGDAQVIGRVVRTSSTEAYRVVGILPKEFLHPEVTRFVPEAYVPKRIRRDLAESRGRGTFILARLLPSQSIEQVNEQLRTMTQRLATESSSAGVKGPQPFDVIRLTSLNSVLRESQRAGFLTAFLWAAALVLIACVNVTSLAIARVQQRHSEIVLRRALGGTAVDIARLIAAECAIVVAAGTALGVLGATWLTSASMHVLPEGMVLLRAFKVDGRVLVFAALTAALCVGVTTIWPAIRATRADLVVRKAGGTSGLTRFSRGLVIGLQVAVATTIAVTGGLVVRSFQRVWQQDVGFRLADTYVLALGSKSDHTADDIGGLVSDLRRVPGVAMAGGSDFWLLQRAMNGSTFDRPATALQNRVLSMGVTGGFFEASGLGLVAGRLPTDDELDRGARVVAVSELVAKAYWPGSPPIGQPLVRKGITYDVVGVVRDARYVSMDTDPSGMIYAPLYADATPHLTTVFLSISADADATLERARALLTARHPTFRLNSATPIRSVLGNTIATRRFRAQLFAAFAMSGIVIAGFGVLSIVTVVASHRTREVGVRMALGATPASILRLVVRGELFAAALGCALGGVASIWTVGAVKSYMYKMTVYDSSVWIGVAAALFAVTSIAALIPALRASRIDPVQALKAE